MRQIQTLAGMAVLLLMAGCSNSAEDKLDADSPVPIYLTCSQLSVTGEETRAATNEHSTLNGEALNIYMPNNTLSGPIAYTVAAEPGDGGVSAMTPSSTVYLYPDYTPIYGFYPTAATMSEGKMVYSVQDDQSGTEYYKLSDLMFAKNEIYKSNIASPVNLEFHHLMSKVIVNVLVDDSTDPTINVTGVYLVNVYKTLEFTPADYTISHDVRTGLTAKDDVGDAGVKVGTATGCAALIPPQSVKGKNFIKVVAQGAGNKSAHVGTVYFAIGVYQEIVFLPGKTYELTIKIDRWSFGQTMDISVSDWTTPEVIANPRLATTR